ncbi:MAG: Thymidylate kinase [Alphaproteobacteria bacterium MarineAlpha9_Bin4]|nr:dTMP kinase [Pelagibacterales bacterium]PPR27586.1 MAG: Thymidylate kinase [Alphaproteobacteria bacterium MarineAlpha9_Bin4]|tara:strand:- start:513 stop:1163 length:651 start_codon:yes stop_codon:yes gene_type:complete
MLNRNKLNKGGFLITFEGIDGSGKSTQIKKLQNLFKKKKIKNIYFTREPGGSEFGNKVRKLLLNDSNINFTNESQILLLLASRFEHYNRFILPIIKENGIVISDRFQDSTYAYQCGNNKKLYDILKYLNYSLFRNFEPKLTILLDINPKLAVQRINKRNKKNLFDKKTLSFYKTVRKNYLKLAREKKRIKVFDASLNKDLLFDNINKIITKEIDKR